MRPRPRGVTLVQVVVAIIAIALLIGILLPMPLISYVHTYDFASMRQVSAAMQLFAWDHDNRLPGVTSDGNIGSIAEGHALEDFGGWVPGCGRYAVQGQTGNGDNPAVRFAILLQGEYLPNDEGWGLIAGGVTRKREASTSAPMNAWMYSWAMAALGGQPTDRDTRYTAPTLTPEEGHYGPVAPRASAWVNYESGNADTPLLSIRNVGADNTYADQGDSIASPYAGVKHAKGAEWFGYVTYADGSGDFLKTPYVDRANFSTANPASGSDGLPGDNLFYVGDANNQGANDHNADAVMVYPTAGDGSGNPTPSVINQW